MNDSFFAESKLQKSQQQLGITLDLLRKALIAAENMIVKCDDDSDDEQYWICNATHLAEQIKAIESVY